MTSPHPGPAHFTTVSAQIIWLTSLKAMCRGETYRTPMGLGLSHLSLGLPKVNLGVTSLLGVVIALYPAQALLRSPKVKLAVCVD
jgi:hypothetical protein